MERTPASNATAALETVEVADSTSSGTGERFASELLRFPLAYLCDLPLATSFVLEARGIPIEIRCMSARSAFLGSGNQVRGAIFLDADELRAVALGVAAERLTSGDFRGLCLLKLADPGFRIDETFALAGAQASEAEIAR